MGEDKGKQERNSLYNCSKGPEEAGIAVHSTGAGDARTLGYPAPQAGPTAFTSTLARSRLFHCDGRGSSGQAVSGWAVWIDLATFILKLVKRSVVNKRT